MVIIAAIPTAVVAIVIAVVTAIVIAVVTAVISATYRLVNLLFGILKTLLELMDATPHIPHNLRKACCAENKQNNNDYKYQLGTAHAEEKRYRSKHIIWIYRY